MSLAPLDLVSAHPWQRVAFTTYALSLSFFEAVILDALVRGGASQALILADVQGVRASLSEQGAQRVGKDYEVEPVAVSSGVFHAKLSVFSAADECHLLVGSGNLTFGGWGGNCEILEHLHPSFAPDAIADAADFFDLIPVTERIRQSAGGHCAAIARDLRRAIQGRPRNGDIRLFHNLDASISEQVVRTVNELGGAVRMLAAAPFWDDGAAIDRLCASIGLDHVFVHAHEHGCIEGVAASNWPRGSRTKVKAVRVALLEAQGPRRLHAKAFEILCRRGRVLLSGSANGTAAGLGQDRNIEVCVARIQRDRTVGWTFSATEPPELQAQLEDAAENDDQTSGVLRAVLEADEVMGEVLTPKMSGPVSIYHLATIGPELLAETTLAPDGAFRISAPRLEEQSWRGRRLVIRVRHQNGRQAEGFVSVASFADITRRAGLLGRRLFAMLAGTETPADVAAVMSWFHEDPQRLGAADPHAIGGGSDVTKRDNSEQLIPVAALSGRYTDAFTATTARDAASHQNWSRFIDHVLLAFRDKRGPFGRTGAGRTGDDEDDEDADTGPAPELVEEDPVIAKSLAVFERLFDLLTKPGDPTRNALIAFDLTQYVCDRLQPEAAQARGWLDRLIKALLNAGVPPERRDDVAVAVLTVLGMSPEPGLCRWARGCLLRLNVDFAGEVPSRDGILGFQSVLPQQTTFSELWTRLRTLRTYQEQVHSYLQALEHGKPSSDYPDLPSEAREEWPVLEDAITSTQSRAKLLFAKGALGVCPRCHITLPSSEVYKLQSTGIATAKNCCGRIVISFGA